MLFLFLVTMTIPAIVGSRQCFPAHITGHAYFEFLYGHEPPTDANKIHVNFHEGQARWSSIDNSSHVLVDLNKRVQYRFENNRCKVEVLNTILAPVQCLPDHARPEDHSRRIWTYRDENSESFVSVTLHPYRPDLPERIKYRHQRKGRLVLTVIRFFWREKDESQEPVMVLDATECKDENTYKQGK